MSDPFEVEDVLDVSGRGVVLVRSLGNPNFPFEGEAKLVPLPTLSGGDTGTENAHAVPDGCVVTGFDVPRALDAKGQPRRDLFAFFLEQKEDIGRFAKGQRVELVS